MKTEPVVVTLKQSLKEYGPALAKNWWLIVLPALMGALGTLKDLAGVEVPRAVWWITAFIAFVVAQFLAFHSVRKERDRLRQFNVGHEALTKIGELRSWLVQHQNKTIASETELGSWIKEYQLKRPEIREFIKNSVSEAESFAYQDIGTFQMVVLGSELIVDGAPHPEHVRWRSMLIRDVHHLKKLIEDYCRQRGWLLDRFVSEL